MMKQKSILIILFSIMTIFNYSCKGKKVKNSLDLMPYSIPTSIDAPENTAVTKLGKGNVTHVAINNNKDYDVQVFMTIANETNIEVIKLAKKEEVVADPFFIKIIEESPSGFIFEKSLGMEDEDSAPSYDFRLIEVVGNKAIIYQCGNSQYFSEKDVKNMYQSVLRNK